MSMLAERKVKQKWSLNPRGKEWSNDANKFGQKMLEKMGWSHGKGLGPNENGLTEHVKVSYKNDSKGMGYKESNDQWTEHDSKFGALLQTLSGERTSEPEVKPIASLEEKSQNSRVRVHYKKFTRGKDLSRCSEKDLANIFGKKSMKPPKTENNETQTETATVETDSFSINSGSMADYFKKKLPSFGKFNGLTIGNNGVLQRASESEDETRGGLGFNDNNEKKLKKKRKSTEESSTATTSKKRKLEQAEDSGISNPAFDPLSKTVAVESHSLAPIAEIEETVTVEESVIQGDVETTRRFELKRRNQDELDVEEVDNSYEVKRKNKKKKDDNPNFEEPFQNGTIDETTNSSEVKRKKKKSKTTDSLPVVNGNSIEPLENGTIEETTTVNSFEVKRKKKKSKPIDSLAIENPTFEESTENGPMEETASFNGFEVKRKVKKNKTTDSLAIDNPNFENDSQNAPLEEAPTINSFEVKRKKKKDKTNESLAIDNPTFEKPLESDPIEGITTPPVNSFEVKRKKKKSKANDSFAVDNPNFEAPVENGTIETPISVSGLEVKRKSEKNDSLAIDNEQPLVNGTIEVNGFEVKRKKKKSKTNDSFAIDNPNFKVPVENGTIAETTATVNSFEVKRKKKKTKANDSLAIDNPNFEKSPVNGTVAEAPIANGFEVKRKKKKSKTDDKSNSKDSQSGAQQPGLDQTNQVNVTVESGNVDLGLNVTSTPVLPNANSTPISSSLKKTSKSVKRRKSVRFNDTTEERIIPNNEQLQGKQLFDINNKVITDGVDKLSKQMDNCQAEVENELNESKVAKLDGSSDLGHEKLPDGTKLKFKNVRFGATPIWLRKEANISKRGYKHLIRGDIVVAFKNTNLHQIAGYCHVTNNQ